jgi:hypothetical protein
LLLCELFCIIKSAAVPNALELSKEVGTTGVFSKVRFLLFLPTSFPWPLSHLASTLIQIEEFVKNTLQKLADDEPTMLFVKHLHKSSVEDALFGHFDVEDRVSQRLKELDALQQWTSSRLLPMATHMAYHALYELRDVMWA